MDFRRLLLPSLALISCCAQAQVRVEANGRTPSQVSLLMDVQARSFSRTVAALTANARAARLRARGHAAVAPFSMPMRVDVLHPAATVKPSTSTTLTLAFDTSGTRTFTTAYKTLLQSIFTTAQPTINAVFGPPATTGVVHVRNYDADIGDRDAVAGGYYTPNNGSGEAEIRFPVYNSDEATTVNFIHTVLLAYQGSKPYTYDAFNEGLVRAAVMKIVRTAGAIPSSLSSDVIESVLQSSYDVGPSYDWYNQRALGGPTFIAANLRSVSLPSSGSVGGLYLLRYLMSGSAWYKVVTEYPGFIAAFNQAYYAQTSLTNNPSGLIALGQTVLNTLSGGTGTVEGLSLASWAQRQFILDTTQSYGTKLLCEPVPVTSSLSGSDYGVYIIQANYFSTALDGSETLLSGTCYPIFWDNNFNRITPSVQDEQIDIAGAYGSVVPNFSNFFSGVPYRVTVDLPVLDQLARVNLPAGSIATASSTEPNTFYGTVEGVPPVSGASYRVLISYPGGTATSATVTNGAFGVDITASAYLKATKVTLTLIKTVGSTNTTLFTRIVDKSVGSLGVDLIVNGDTTYSTSLPSGISLIGFPIDPFSSSAPAILGISPASLQMARYNATKAAYDQYPYLEAPTVGHGYYVRLPAAQSSFSVAGRGYANFPMSVALRPGWNIISSPLKETVSFSNVQVVHSTENPATYANSTGVTIGADVFEFTRGTVDSASGLVETGSMTAATSFAPGKGYLVRVLAAEGVTLTFFPSSPTVGPYGTAATTHGWGINVTLSDGTRTMPVHLGAIKEAKSDLDWRYCSMMAPSMGGLQAVATRGTTRMFRDIRQNTGTLQRYPVHLEGLKVGATYTLRFPVEKGIIRSMQLVDQGVARTITASTVFSFKATATTRDLEVRLTGVAL